MQLVEQFGPMLDVLVVTVLEEIEISLVAGCVGFHLRVGVTVGGSQGDKLIGLEVPGGLVRVPVELGDGDVLLDERIKYSIYGIRRMS